MRVEIPELKRCCFCLPLRRGLLVWVYLNVALSVLSVVIGIQNFLFSRRVPPMYIVSSILLVFGLLNIGFSIIFLIRAHQKNYQHLWIYYRFAIALLVVYILIFLIYVGMAIYISVVSVITFFLGFNTILGLICTLAVQAVMQGYFILMVRSEIRKLERNTKFEFINHTTQPVCTAQTDSACEKTIF